MHFCSVFKFRVLWFMNSSGGQRIIWLPRPASRLVSPTSIYLSCEITTSLGRPPRPGYTPQHNCIPHKDGRCPRRYADRYLRPFYFLVSLCAAFVLQFSCLNLFSLYICSFYNKLFEDHFHMCLEFPAQNRYIIVFPLICGHFQNCTHELCPEEVTWTSLCDQHA